MVSSEIVLVDDETPILEIQQEALSLIGLTARAFSDPLAAWDYIYKNDVAIVVSDWNMPGMTGMELLFKTRALPRPPYVIMITAFGTVDRAVQAMNQGAFSFLEKPFDLHRYNSVVKDALARAQGAQGAQCSQVPQGVQSAAEQASKVRAGSKKMPIAPVIQSPLMQRTFEVAKSAAATDSTILLLGESGTGKEVLADFIHAHSQRTRNPMVKVNCGALPEHLMESELFGHEKGSFTGAERRNIGRFEQANGGTLFLDEIGDLLLPLQVKLLRTLQERTIERVGSSTSIAVDFRLVCATHCDLDKAVLEKRFRQDLYYRIKVIPITVPPLRERIDDIEPLALHFFTLLRNRLPSGPQGFRADAMRLLTAFQWPGNVRQLRNAVEYALVLCKSPMIGPDDLPEDVRGGSIMPSTPAPVTAVLAASAPVAESAVVSSNTGLKKSMQDAEREAICAALTKHHWRVTAVARDLGLSRSSLYERMKLYGITRPNT